MRFERSAGILLPISQLYGEQGIGSLGENLKHFIDFIEKTGSKYFQICPLGHTADEHSPYICYSAYAGNPLYNWEKHEEKNFSILLKKIIRICLLLLKSLRDHC